jgi:diacylglycerol kinase (ATP)
MELKARIKGYFIKLKDGLLCSAAGFLVTIKEAAFQLELLIGLPAIGFALRSEVSSTEKAILVSSVLFLFIAEAINTAIERTVDRISTVSHPISRKAKDVGSLIVFLTAVNAVVVWSIIYFI